MGSPVTVKVYGAFSPVRPEALGPLAPALDRALPGPEAQDEPCLALEGDLLRISFEGQYFPLEETLAALTEILPATAQGKLDCLDLEDWQLTRHVWRDGAFHISQRPLNHVLDFSGH